MPRKGRFLEVLVKQLQEFLGPQGLEVRSPELFYEGAKQIGEIDVTIRGRLGSATVFVGIECRDRPEDGPQGIPWLTQISGKQRLLKVDKMIAVSTTGFTSDAVRVAEDLGIDLLTIVDMGRVNLAEWFQTIEFSWQEETYEISGMIDVDTEPKTAIRMLPIKNDTRFLRIDATKQLLSLEEFMKPDLDTLFTQLPNTNNGVVQLETTIQGKGQIDAELEGEQFKITRLVIPIRLTRELVGGRLLLNVCRNPRRNEVVAVTGTGLLETSKRKLKVLAMAKKNSSDSNLRDLRINFLTEDDKPYVLPEGTAVTLYGRM